MPRERAAGRGWFSRSGAVSRCSTAWPSARTAIPLSNLCQQLGLSLSTAHQLLTILEQQRYVCCDPKTRYWSIGVQACIVGSAFVKARDLLEIARPRTRGLVEESGETINLAVLDGSEAVFLEQVECRQMMRAVARPGVRIPFHCSGVGKAFLATLPEMEVAQILRKHGLPRLTPRTLTTLARLREDIERTRKRGSASMTRSTRWTCAASLQSSSTSIASPVGAVSVSGPAVHIPDERIANPRDLVRKTALAVT